MMKKITYFKQTCILVLWIPLVILLFRFISDRQMAALVAGLGFLLLPLFFFGYELSKNKMKSWLVVIGCLQFLIFALPIFLLRVLNWGIAFNDLFFLGIPASSLHHYSNVSYFALLGVMCFKSYQSWRNKKRQLES